MASLYRLLIPGVIGSLLIILDFIADVAFAVHLQKHESRVLYPIAVTMIILSVLAVNFVAALGIQELGDEIQKPEWKNIRLTWLTKGDLKTKIILVILTLFGLLPHVLVGLHFWLLRKNKKKGNDTTYERLREFLETDSSVSAVKEVQSVLESGGMIYLKCFYLTLYALLYVKNWPVLFGLFINVVSAFFGLRKDMVTVTNLKGLAFLVTFINLSLRLIIVLVLASATAPWVYFFCFGCSIALLLSWGAWLMADLPVSPEKFNTVAKAVQPKNIAENFVSSVMYTFFLVPCDVHTAIAIFPFIVASFAIPCTDNIALVLKIIMPFAGIIGLLPPKLWWTIFRLDNHHDPAQLEQEMT